jgi:hypothetical protein
VRANSAKKLTR